MNVLRQRKYLFALLALLLVFAACKGESPTAPPPSTGVPGGGGTGGGTTPPTGATIALTVSNPNPLVSSTTVITATVTQNNSPVPNGTAVEFVVTPGDNASFTDTTAATTIRTTTNGVASATLTATTAGTYTVTAIVNNVQSKATVVFGQSTTTPPPTNTTPTITGATPTTGLPTAGTLITIAGTNLKAPIRVFFVFPDGTQKEAFVNPASITPTSVQVIAPNVSLGTAQTLAATIKLINQAGTPSEAVATGSPTFTYAVAQLTPSITTLSPNSGPIEGGTRVTIFGNGFEQNVQVGFSTGGAPWTNAQVISTTITQIVAITPAARDIEPNGSGTLTGPVAVRVLNLLSGKDATLSAAFKYAPKMQITTVGPTEGPFTGGTRFTIDGIGFDDPLAVVTAKVAAQVVKVSGSEVIAITNGVQPQGCSDVTGPITVTNTNNGDSADGPAWIFRVPKPIILQAPPPTPLGGTFTVPIFGAFGTPRFKIGNFNASVISSTFDPNTNVTTFTVQVPSNLPLQQQPCGGVSGVTFPATTSFDLSYTSAETSCTDTFTNGATILPPVAASIALTPTGFTPFTATFVAGNPAAVPPTTDSVTPSSPQTVTLVNNGTAALTINSVTTNGAAGCSQFAFAFPAAPATLNQCDSVVFTAVYQGPTPPAKGSGTCSIVVNTSIGTKTIPLLGITQ